MAWIVPVPPSSRHPRPRWQVCYRDETGRQHSAGIYAMEPAARAVKRRIERGDIDANNPVVPLEGGLPVGMAIASVREGAVHLEEMDVLPAHGRRGLGTRLLATVCAWARAQGYAAVTLSTFSDVPWNGPFYRKHGFKDLQPEQWTPGMWAIREQEAQHGLRVEARVFMRGELGEVDLPPEAIEEVAR